MVVTQAADGFSFHGHFNQDNDVALIEFSIDFQSTFQVLVTSFNELNGFNPNLFLLNPDGTQAEGLDAEATPIEVNNQDAGNSPLIATIAKGSYVLAVGQQFNLPNITNPGFSMDDSPFYYVRSFWKSQPVARGSSIPLSTHFLRRARTESPAPL